MVQYIKAQYTNILWVVALMLLIWILDRLSIHYPDAFFDVYTLYFYKPIQKIKSLLWQDVMINYGDLLYLLSSLILLAAIVKVVLSIRYIASNTTLFIDNLFRLI